MQAHEGQVLARRPRLLHGTQQFGPHQHRVEPADEEEDADAEQVLDADDLVVGAEPEVTRPAPQLVLAQRRGSPEQAADRVVGETEPDEPADHGEEVAHVDAHVVLVGALEVVVTDGDLTADPTAQEPAADPEGQAGQHVEADQAPPERPAYGDGGRVQTVTSSPSRPA